jgi:hypothetical protein
MNEKLNPTAHSNGTGARGCERAEDLVAYLYNEAAPEEANDFRRHLTGCAVCREELAAFGGVREAVGEWRADALSAVPALGVSESLLGISESFKTDAVRLAPKRKRSAVAALREFFTLSPLWLRAGAFAATLVVCALVALTLARAEIRWDSNGLAFKTGVQERIVKETVRVPVSSGYTPEQVKSMLADERVKWEQEKNQQIEIMKAEWKKQVEVTHAPDGSALASQRQGGKRTALGNPRRNRQNVNEDLAGVQGDIFNPNEERVPRLTDILGAVKPNKTNER